MTSCYYQGCPQPGTTKEHIPPKSFFPIDQRDQLLTVKSCKLHNNEKSSDDIYVLAQICLNASPRNKSREMFIECVLPQLGHNGDALRKTLSNQAEHLSNGAVRYKVDTRRTDRFFTALSCGIVFKACGGPLTSEYTTTHVYHNFHNEKESDEEKILKEALLDFYSGDPMAVMEFGRVNTLNHTVYSVKIFGIPAFKSSITIVHEFFGAFRVTSLLTKHVDLPHEI